MKDDRVGALDLQIRGRVIGERVEEVVDRVGVTV